MTHASTYAAFLDQRLLRAGELADVAAAVKVATDTGESRPILIFDDTTGAQIDFDLRGSILDVLARLQAPPAKTRGRPRLGVEGREITLLPRHWNWLDAQPNGASATLRRLVEEAARSSVSSDRRRAARDAVFRFLSAIAGNEVGFEEASRALYADDERRFADLTRSWPQDVREHALNLLNKSATADENASASEP